MVQARVSFELNEDMVRLLREEFDPPKVVARFAEAIANKKPEEIQAIGKQFFEDYGRDWMKRTLQLGEEYPDRTYEVLKAAADKTGTLRFSLIPQRFLEIAYLSTQDISTLPVEENNARRLVYKMVDCYTFKTLKEKCGNEAASLLLCKNACLTACEVLHQDLDLDALIGMDADMVKDGYCQFVVTRA